MPNEASTLFDQCPLYGSSQFYGALQDNGWQLQSYENSILMVKEGQEQVVKIFDPKGIQNGYHTFVTRLMEDFYKDKFLHFPRIFRYRPGIVIIEKLSVLEEEYLEDWRYEAMAMGTRLSLHEDLSPRMDDFFEKNPQMHDHVTFLHMLHFHYGFRYSIKGEDILQRPDGTPVMVDPVL